MSKNELQARNRVVYEEIASTEYLSELVEDYQAFHKHPLVVFQTSALLEHHGHWVTVPTQSLMELYQDLRHVSRACYYPRINTTSFLGYLALENHQWVLYPATRAQGPKTRLIFTDDFFRDHEFVMRQFHGEDARITRMRVPIQEIQFLNDAVDETLRQAMTAMPYHIAFEDTTYHPNIFDVLPALPSVLARDAVTKEHLVLILDYDAMLSYQGDTFADVVANLKELLLKAISKNLVNLADVSSIEVVIGSARQSQALDILNNEINKNGLCFLVFTELVASLRVMLAPLGISVMFNQQTLADVISASKDGTMVQATAQGRLVMTPDYADHYADSSKFQLLMLHIHQAAQRFSDRKVRVLFADDQEETVLPFIIEIFSRFPDLVPNNVVFAILRYCLPQPEPDLAHLVTGTGSVHPDPRAAFLYLSHYARVEIPDAEEKPILSGHNRGFAELLCEQSNGRLFKQCSEHVLAVWCGKRPVPTQFDMLGYQAPIVYQNAASNIARAAASSSRPACSS